LWASGIFFKVGFDRQQEVQVAVHDAPHNPSGAFMPNLAVAEFMPSLSAPAAIRCSPLRAAAKREKVWRQRRLKKRKKRRKKKMRVYARIIISISIYQSSL
jgi:hypothetical protein